MSNSPTSFGPNDAQGQSTPRWWVFASCALLALGVCATVAGAGYWAGRRSRPPAVEVHVPTATIPAPIKAYVAGEVAIPGVYTLPANARVNDLVTAAGGLLLNADASAINLAARLTDGQRVIVPPVRAASTTPPDGPQPGASPRDGASQLLNLNTAGASDLALLPRIGPVTAAAIIEWREQNGGFKSVEELLLVRGIGQVTLDAVRPFVTAP